MIKNYSKVDLGTLVKNELVKEVDEFMDEEWIPFFIENFIKLPAVIPSIEDVINFINYETMTRIPKASALW